MVHQTQASTRMQMLFDNQSLTKRCWQLLSGDACIPNRYSRTARNPSLKALQDKAGKWHYLRGEFAAASLKP